MEDIKIPKKTIRNPTGKGGLGERRHDMGCPHKAVQARLAKAAERKKQEAIRLEDHYDDMVRIALGIAKGVTEENVGDRDRAKILLAMMDKVEKARDTSGVSADIAQKHDEVKAEIGPLMLRDGRQQAEIERLAAENERQRLENEELRKRLEGVSK